VLCEGGPGVHHSVGKLLDSLASQIDRTGLLRTLYLVHRLDKDTTGVMVLAKCVFFSAKYCSIPGCTVMQLIVNNFEDLGPSYKESSQNNLTFFTELSGYI